MMLQFGRDGAMGHGVELYSLDLGSDLDGAGLDPGATTSPYLRFARY